MINYNMFGWEEGRSLLLLTYKPSYLTGYMWETGGSTESIQRDDRYTFVQEDERSHGECVIVSNEKLNQFIREKKHIPKMKIFNNVLQQQQIKNANTETISYYFTYCTF